MARKAPKLHPEDIKAQIRKRGTTLTQLALDNDLGKSTIRVCLLKSVPRAEKVIASFLNLSTHALWPDRYDVDGNRIKQPKKESSPIGNVRHRKKRMVNFTEEVKS